MSKRKPHKSHSGPMAPGRHNTQMYATTTNMCDRWERKKMCMLLMWDVLLYMCCFYWLMNKTVLANGRSYIDLMKKKSLMTYNTECLLADLCLSVYLLWRGHFRSFAFLKICVLLLSVLNCPLLSDFRRFNGIVSLKRNNYDVNIMFVKQM